jgi:hypothetical protein
MFSERWYGRIRSDITRPKSKSNVPKEKSRTRHSPSPSLLLVPFLAQEIDEHQQPQHARKDGLFLKLGGSKDKVLPPVLETCIVERRGLGLERHPETAERLEDRVGHDDELVDVDGIDDKK